MAVSAIIIRSISMLFRVMLTEKTGAEGIGLYQLVMSIYLVFVTVSSSGISLCATRLFTELSAKGKPAQARYAIEKCIVISFIIGLSGGTLLFFGADFSAGFILHDMRAAPSLRLLSVSLPFLAVSACIRGYFCARRKSLPTSAEQFIEQIIETGVFITVFSFYHPSDLTQACCITVAGTTSAEVVSFIYSVICYRIDIGRIGTGREKADSLGRKMLPVMLPVSANACLRSGLSAAENALIPQGLCRYGFTQTMALSQYGIISGMAMPVLVFPSVIVFPFAALIIPEISEARAKDDYSSIKRMTEKMVESSLRYSVPVTIILIFFAVPLCEVLFGSSEAGKYLSLLAPVIPFMYLDSIVDGILKGLNEQTSYFIFNTIDSVIRVLLTVILLPVYGIYGVTAVIIISELINTAMSVWRLVKVTSFRLSLVKAVILPCLLTLLFCLFAAVLPVIGTKASDVTVKILFCCIMYGIVCILSKKQNCRKITAVKKPG